MHLCKPLKTIALTLSCSTLLYAQSNISVFLDTTYQRINAIGSMELSDDEITDLECGSMRMHWDPEYNKNLEMSGNDNADPNVLDLTKFSHNPDYVARAKKAINNGINIFIATVWSPPGWMKELTETSTYACPDLLCGGILRTDMYEEYAEWLVGSIKAWKRDVGVDLFAVSLQNEPEFEEPYGSCVYNPTTLKNLLLVVGKKFKREGITTKIYYGEILPQQGNVLNFFRAVNNDTAARNYVHAFATHNYDGDGIHVGGAGAAQWKSYYAESQRIMPKKELWMTETSGHSNDVKGMMTLIGNMYNALYYGNVSAWNFYGLQKTDDKIYNVHKHFTKFVKPGSMRVKALSSDTTDILSLAFKNANTGKVVVILSNRNSTTAKDVTISGVGLPESMNAYQTTSTVNYESKGSLSNTSSFKINLPPNSITTLAGNYNVKVIIKLKSGKYIPSCKQYSNIVKMTFPDNSIRNVNVFSMDGQKIISSVTHGENEFSIDFTGMSKGTFIIKASNKNNALFETIVFE